MSIPNNSNVEVLANDLKSSEQDDGRKTKAAEAFADKLGSKNGDDNSNSENDEVVSERDSF